MQDEDMIEQNANAQPESQSTDSTVEEKPSAAEKPSADVPTPPREEDYSKVSFYIEGVHDELLGDKMTEQQQKRSEEIKEFCDGFKNVCRKNEISAQQAMAVTDFIKDGAKEVLHTASVEAEKEKADKKELLEKYASQNIGNDQMIESVHKYAQSFLRERGLEDSFKDKIKDPQFLHLMSMVRKSLITSSEVERAINVCAIDRGKIAQDLNDAIVSGDKRRISTIRATLKTIEAG